MMASLGFKLLVFLFFVLNFVVAKNNVCKNWSDYWYGNRDTNKNCMYNPDMYMDTPQLLEKYFGKYEVHEVLTSDGYFPTIFRIPRKNHKGTILFVHPMLSDSILWIGSGEESWAYYFWKKGFEIWMLNKRGTDYSKKHVNLTINDNAFWNFSFHETAIYDLRESLKYIYEINNNTSPAVIAYSQGCTESLVYSSLFPEEAQRLSKVFILLGPVSNLRYSMLKFLAVSEPFLEKYIQVTKKGDIARSDKFLARLFHFICTRQPGFCIFLMNMILYGKTREGEDPLLVPILYAQNPRATTIKTLLHFFHIQLSGKFIMYDHGNKNHQIYGSCVPPEYPISKILAPTYLVYSREDKIGSIRDSENLYKGLSESARIYGSLKVKGMNHIDPILGLHRKEQIHDEVLLLLNKIFS